VNKKIRGNINQIRLGKIQQIGGQTDHKRREGKKQNHSFCFSLQVLRSQRHSLLHF